MSKHGLQTILSGYSQCYGHKHQGKGILNMSSKLKRDEHGELLMTRRNVKVMSKMSRGG